MKTSRCKLTSNMIFRGSQNKDKKSKQQINVYLKNSYDVSDKSKKKTSIPSLLLSDRHQKQYINIKQTKLWKQKSFTPKSLGGGLCLNNKSIKKKIEESKKNEQGKNCRIIISTCQQKQRQLFVQPTSIRNIINFLQKQFSPNYYYQTLEGNLALDFVLTQQTLNANFLYGKTIYLKPIKKLNLSKPLSAINLPNFQIIKLIGSGGFSNVFLCRFKQDGKFYALKLIDKQSIIKNKKKRIIMNQRNIMKLAKHPFIIQMKFAFESQKYLAFVLEYCAGGQLFSLIKKHRRISQKTAKFYIIQILLGLAYLHQNQIVYRDIKPQNILINIDGHVKIADLGLAKPNMFERQMAYSFCGSPQYMSPQMILQQGHTFPVDFYCTGALLYQLLTGLPPFYSRNPDQIYQAVLSQDLTFPQDVIMSNQCKNLLNSLLCKDSKYRLGKRQYISGSLHGVKEILSHPWFGKNSYQQYLNKQIQPPINYLGIQKIDIDMNTNTKGQTQRKQVLNEQLNFKNNTKMVMKNFYYDYRKNTIRTKDQTKQNIVKQPIRNKSNTSTKNKTPFLELNRNKNKNYSQGKLIYSNFTHR